MSNARPLSTTNSRGTQCTATRCRRKTILCIVTVALLARRRTHAIATTLLSVRLSVCLSVTPMIHAYRSTIVIITSLPKIIWEEGRVPALSHTYAVKYPLVTMARPKFAPISTPYRGPIPKLHYLPHPWTRPTYDAKRHPDPIRRFSTMHWTDRPTDRQIVHGKVWQL